MTGDNASGGITDSVATRARLGSVLRIVAAAVDDIGRIPDSTLREYGFLDRVRSLNTAKAKLMDVYGDQEWHAVDTRLRVIVDDRLPVLEVGANDLCWAAIRITDRFRTGNLAGLEARIKETVETVDGLFEAVT